MIVIDDDVKFDFGNTSGDGRAPEERFLEHISNLLKEADN
jgi:hypothetical protein